MSAFFYPVLVAKELSFPPQIDAEAIWLSWFVTWRAQGIFQVEIGLGAR